LLLAAGLASTMLALPAAGQAPQPAAPDSAPKPVIVWRNVTPLAQGSRIVDIAFTNPGLNIINPGEMAWLLDATSKGLLAVAAKPIAGTASAGEEMGRRATGLLRAPAAVFAAAATQYVLEQAGRLVILRSGWVDSVDVGSDARGTERDIAVGAGGLVYVLLGGEVRVFADPPGKSPLLTLRLDPKLLPVAGMAVSARGDVYVAGTGAMALAVYELDATGKFRLARSRTARELNVQRVGGIALSPALLLPYETREGWVSQDRFTVLSDTGRRKLLALESSTLAVLGNCDLTADVPGATPGRLDISNRGQIAFADPESGAAYALPARILGGLIEPATIRWRTIERDSTGASGSGAP
jgi:hypothetical protein